MSCSSSTANEDGEAGNWTGMSLITALTPGRLTVIGGNPKEEAGIVDSQGIRN